MSGPARHVCFTLTTRLMRCSKLYLYSITLWARASRTGSFRLGSPSHQFLAQKDARHSRMAINLAECLVAMTLIEFGRLEVDGSHHRRTAAPSPSLVLGVLHDAAAQTVFAQGGRDEEQ